MAKKQIIKEASMQTAATSNYNDLFHKISALHGAERHAFCTTLTQDEKKAYIQHLKERDCEKVTGIFRCHEPPGGMVQMTAMAYLGETPKAYEFFDGEQYTIPRYLARRLENEFQGCGCWYPTNKYLLDDAGKAMVHVGKKNKRFGFGSMDFQ